MLNTNASSGLPDPLGVLGGVAALMLAGGAAGVISANGARAGQARVAAAKAEFFGG